MEGKTDQEEQNLKGEKAIMKEENAFPELNRSAVNQGQPQNFFFSNFSKLICLVLAKHF